MKSKNIIAICAILFIIIATSCTEENVLLDTFTDNDSINDTINDSIQYIYYDANFDSLFTSNDSIFEIKIPINQLSNVSLSENLSIQFPQESIQNLCLNDTIQTDSVVIRYQINTQKSQFIFNQISTTDYNHLYAAPIIFKVHIFDLDENEIHFNYMHQVRATIHDINAQYHLPFTLLYNGLSDMYFSYTANHLQFTYENSTTSYVQNISSNTWTSVQLNRNTENTGNPIFVKTVENTPSNTTKIYYISSDYNTVLQGNTSVNSYIFFENIHFQIGSSGVLLAINLQNNQLKFGYLPITTDSSNSYYEIPLASGTNTELIELIESWD